MKRKIFSILLALVLALSLCLMTAVPVNAASITTVTPIDITVGTAYTNLTGPVIAEDAAGEFNAGLIILTAPVGFAFDTVSDVTATVTGAGTPLRLNGTSSQIVTPTTSTITITVTAVSVTEPSTITYTGIRIKDSDDTSGSTDNLVFSGAAGVTGSAGTLTSIPNVVNALTVDVQPLTAVAGVFIAPAVQIKAVDEYGNVIAGQSIAASKIAGTGVLSGTTPQLTDAAGIATFDDLSINLIGSDKQLRFTADGVTVDSGVFTITPAAFADYTVEPEAGPYVAGTAFYVTITAVDQFGNPLGADYTPDAPYEWITTASEAPDTTAPNIGTLAPFTDGVGTTPVTLYCAEAGVTFTVTDASAITGTSAGIDVNPAAVDTLTIVQEPTDAVAAVAIAPPVTVEAMDQYGNVIEGQNIAASLIAGDGVLSGTLTQTTDGSGIATFDDLSINLVGTDKQLQFAADAVIVDSVVFAITLGGVDTLTIEVEPSGAVAGEAIAPPIEVKAVDAGSNPIATQDITVTLLAGDGTLSGTLMQTTDSLGIATFDDLSINLIGADKQLQFTADAVTVDSEIFEITPGEAVGFTFEAIGTQDAGVAFEITINAVDAYGNADTGYVGTATLSDLTGTIDPGDTGAFIDGVWTDNITILLPYTDNAITATDVAITGTSAPFDVSPYPVYNTTTGEGYLTIQEAVDVASADDTLTVGPGTYVGDITISANLTIVSSGGSEVTKITGTGGTDPVITIGDYTVTLEGFEIDPGDEGVYIYDISADNVVTIEDSVIHGNAHQGIWVEGTVYGTLNILNNIIADNGYEGIRINEVDDGGTVVIQGNKVGAWEDADYDLSSNNQEGIFIDYIYDGSTVTIGGDTEAEANLIMENGEEGIYVTELYYGSTLTIEGNTIGAYAYDGYTFEGNYDEGIYVYYVDYGSTLTIKDNDISKNQAEEGIEIYQVGFDDSSFTADEYYALYHTYGANNINIEGNNLSENSDSGLYISHADFATYITIQDNTISANNDEGMELEYFGQNGYDYYLDDDTASVHQDLDYPDYFGPVVLVKGNTITDNYYDGIYQYDDWEYGTSVTIEDNVITGNLDAGIYHNYDVMNDAHVLIKGNTIASNGMNDYSGIEWSSSEYIDYASSYTVENNLIAGNFYYGIYVYGVEDSSTLTIRGNTIGAGSDAEGNLYGGNYYEAIYIEYVEYDSTAEITRNNISGNQDDAIYIYEVYDNSSVSITRNNIEDNEYYALEVDYLYDDGSSIDVHYNNITGNDSGGIYHNDSSSDYVNIDATSNWWGDDSGPYHSSYNPDGLGDEVSDYVLYSPWLSSPAVCEVKAELIAGWNTLSTPIVLDGASDELAELTMDMDSAYGFSGGVWVPITTANDELEPCGAFYVKMNSKATIDLVPSESYTDPPSKSLSTGWNLVSMANLVNMAAEDALASAYLVSGDLSGFVQVVSPSVNSVTWSAVRGPAIDTALGYDMLPTEGYWIFMTNAGTLAGFTSTPIQLY
ncbi:right-handed parallel beta-helix repeat-containing protein [Chloroflexota bacterium]